MQAERANQIERLISATTEFGEKMDNQASLRSRIDVSEEQSDHRAPGTKSCFVKFCFPTVPVFPFTWAPFNGVISYLTAKCGGKVHDRASSRLAPAILRSGAPSQYHRVGKHVFFLLEGRTGAVDLP
jgi:hypothetical protein